MADSIHATLAPLSVPLAGLAPHPENPRGHDDDALRDSLMLNGQYRPIVVQKATGRVLAGNGTYAAALGLGWTHVAAVVLDVEDEQARRILLADNRLAERSRNDPAALLSLLESLDGELAGTGYDPAAVDELAAAVAALSAPPESDSDDRALYSPGSDLRQLILAYDKPDFERLVDLLTRLRLSEEDTFTAVVQRSVAAAVAAVYPSSRPETKE